LLAWYVSLGIGLGGSTMVPASLVITNWFKERRGTVLGERADITPQVVAKIVDLCA
jgi:hypothetical protein